MEEPEALGQRPTDHSFRLRKACPLNYQKAPAPLFVTGGDAGCLRSRKLYKNYRELLL